VTGIAVASVIKLQLVRVGEGCNLNEDKQIIGAAVADIPAVHHGARQLRISGL